MSFCVKHCEQKSKENYNRSACLLQCQRKLNQESTQNTRVPYLNNAYSCATPNATLAICDPPISNYPGTGKHTKHTKHKHTK